MKGKTLLKLLIGVSLLLFIIFKVGSLELLSSMFSLGYLGLLILFLHVFFQILLSSFNIKLLSAAIGHSISYRYLLSSYVYVWSLGKFLPGGLGELSVAYYLKKKGMSTANSIFVAVGDKVITLATLGAISFIGISFVFGFTQVLWGLAIIPVILLPLIAVKKLNHLLTKIKRRVRNPKLLLMNIIVTLTKSMLAALTVFLLLLLLGVKFNPLYILIINSIIGMIVLIPITIGGIGTKEASAIYLYSLFGIASSTILGIYLMLRAVIFVSTGIFALTFITRKKIKFTKTLKNGAN